MAFDTRRLAVVLGGFCSFLNLYSPQAVLPALAREMDVGVSEISAIMTAGTLSIALTAPFSGAIADVVGRKRMIVAAAVAVSIPGILIAFAHSVDAIVVLRFVQGLLLPPIFATTVAYIGDEWPPSQVAGVAGLYISGSSIGGFCGRLIPGVLDDLIGWRPAYGVLAVLTLASALAIALVMPRERNFVRSPSLSASTIQMLRHLRNPQIVATCAVGFGVLFNFVAVFTYISFHLAAPPYLFSSSLLGALFVTFLAGAATVSSTGVWVKRWGRRAFVLRVMAVWICAISLTLAPSVTAIMIGLSLCAACGMFVQATSTGYVTASVKEGRSSAVGLYVSSFYLGGSIGAFLPGLIWNAAGWRGAVAVVIAVQIAMAAVVGFIWTRAAPTAAPEPPAV